MSHPTAVVVGASRGIGLALATRLREEGWTVIGTVRKAPEGELASRLDKIIEGVDVTDAASCGETLLRGLEDVDQVDLLVYNAGIADLTANFALEPIKDVDLGTFSKQFEVNAAGAVRVLQAVDDKIKRGSKVLLMSTYMASIEMAGNGALYGYRASKAALNMVGQNLRAEYGARGVVVTLAHPGLVKTDMTSYIESGIEIGESVDGLVRVIDEMSTEAASKTTLHGGFVDAPTGKTLPW